MNQAIYNHKQKVKSKLLKRQEITYRELRKLWCKSRKLFVPSNDMIHKIEELEALNNSLNMQIENISDDMLRFELFGSN